MAFRNLQQFVRALKDQGELVVVDAPVDVDLEVAEIHRRVISASGPAILFKNTGYSFPVVTNLFGTSRRVDIAFGDRPKEIVRSIASMPDVLMPLKLRNLWGLKGTIGSLLKTGFRSVGNAPVLANQIPNADLTALPALKSWSEDGGQFLTLPLVHTGSLSAKPENLGIYRMQIFDSGEAGMHFQIGKGGGYHLHEAESAGQSLPTNVYLGGPPALILSAVAPLPENVPELMLASLVMGEKLSRTKTGVLSAAAEAEFCLVGEVPAKVRRAEGPFGDHYGYYSLTHDFPVFRPKAIYHRKDAIFPATVVGKPRQEDFFLGDYLQELLSPLFPLVMPSVESLWSYGETGYHALAGAVLKERYGRECLSSVFRILGEGQLSLTKFLLGVDKKLDLRDFTSVLIHILERVNWANDLHIFSETSMDTLDYTGASLNKGSKGVILGMGEQVRELPAEFHGDVSSELATKIKPFCKGCLVIEAAKTVDISALLKNSSFNDWPLLVLVDDAEKATWSEASFLWTTFTRFEPATDIHSASTKVIRNRIAHEGPVLIDARMKHGYPDELFCDERTSKKVTERWKEYFPSGVEMGSSDYGHLR